MHYLRYVAIRARSVREKENNGRIIAISRIIWTITTRKRGCVKVYFICIPVMIWIGRVNNSGLFLMTTPIYRMFLSS